MNCMDVRENLSAYIDDMLDKQIKDMMDAHLSTCKACRQELVSMRALVEELGGLGDIKAPEDFLDTLHERLDTESFWARIKEMLFVPAQIKIPLEFATISIVGVLIFSLYSVYSPQDHLAFLPQDLSVESTPESAVIHEMKSAPSASSQSTDEDEAFKYEQAVKNQPIELALMLPQKAGSDDLGVAEDKEEITFHAAAVPDRRQKDSGRVGYKASTAGKALPEKKADEAEEETTADTTGPAVEKQAAVSTQESPPLDESNEIIQKIHELIGLRGGRILSEEYDRENGKDRIILAEVPAGQYKGFVDKVSMLAQLKEPLPAMPVDLETPVLIRIRLIPGQ